MNILELEIRDYYEDLDEKSVEPFDNSFYLEETEELNDLQVIRNAKYVVEPERERKAIF